MTIWEVLHKASVDLAYMANQKYRISYTCHDRADQGEIADIAIDAAQEAAEVMSEMLIKLSDIVAEWSEAPNLDKTDRELIKEVNDSFRDFLTVARDKAEDQREMAREAAE